MDWINYLEISLTYLLLLKQIAIAIWEASNGISLVNENNQNQENQETKIHEDIVHHVLRNSFQAFVAEMGSDNSEEEMLQNGRQ